MAFELDTMLICLSNLISDFLAQNLKALSPSKYVQIMTTLRETNTIDREFVLIGKFNLF